MKHPMINLQWNSIWHEGEIHIHPNFFLIDADAQKKMINDWSIDLEKLNFQIRTDQPITHAALPRLNRLFFGHREIFE